MPSINNFNFDHFGRTVFAALIAGILMFAAYFIAEYGEEKLKSAIRTIIWIVKVRLMGKKRTITDDELRAMDTVNLQVVADYLGMPIDKLRARAKKGCYDFVESNLNEGSSRWSFWIHRERLIAFKNGGRT